MKKIHVRAHTRRLKSGKVVTIKAHDVIRYSSDTKNSKIKRKSKRGEELQSVVIRKTPKVYKPTEQDYTKGFHVFDDGSVKYYDDHKKIKSKETKTPAVKFTKTERKKGFKLTADGSVYYTPEALKAIRENS